MDDQRFDSFTRALADGSSRRAALRRLIGLGLGVASAAVSSGGTDARHRGGMSGPTTTSTTPPAEPCSNGEQLCGESGLCCPTGTCARSGNTDYCCQANPCGLDCCESEFQCCGGECCPDGYGCPALIFGESPGVEEEVCCPFQLICDAPDKKCCAADEQCCLGPDGQHYCIPADGCCIDLQCQDTLVGQCEVPVCEPFSWTCVGVPGNDGTTCDGPDECFEYRCEEGVCTSGDILCVPANPCNVGLCDETTGQCAEQYRGDGTECPGGVCLDGDCCPNDDVCGGDACCSPESCCQGACCDGLCDSNDECCPSATGYICEVTGECCADAQLCCSVDGCCSGACNLAGICCPSPDFITCGEDCCDLSTETCCTAPNGDEYCAILDGSDIDNCGSCGNVCDDGNVCTTNACVDGQCVHTDIICQQDSNPCTEHVCQPESGCAAIPASVGDSCDDGLFCTTGTTCQSNGTCGGGQEVTCTSPPDCKRGFGTCLEVTEGCSYLDNEPLGSPCDGGDGRCLNGSCVPCVEPGGVVCPANPGAFSCCNPSCSAAPQNPDCCICD